MIAVVELDDSSHKGRAKEDGARDALLTDAGYRVVRYPRVPDIEQVKADFAPPAVPKVEAGATSLPEVRPER